MARARARRDFDEPARRRARVRWLAASCLAVLAFGLVDRVLAVGTAPAEWDPAWFRVMATSFREHGEFVVPWSGAYTHHYPPLYPVLLAAFDAAFGASPSVPEVASLFTGIALVAVAYFATRDLFGHEKALVMAAFVAAFPFFASFERLGYSESLATLFFLLTLWGIIRSLDRPRFIVVAGLFAGLGYLTKSSMGPFFLLAAAGGFLWRFAYVRWAVFRDRWYLLGGLVFLALVAAWTARNVAHFGLAGYETQPYATEALRRAFTRENWLPVFAAKVGFTVLFLAVAAAPFAGGLRAALRRWRDPATSALLLAAFLPAFIALFFMTAFTFTENRPRFADPTEVRYLLPSVVALAWLGLANTDLGSEPRAALGARRVLLVGAMALAALVVAVAGSVRDAGSGFRAAIALAGALALVAALLDPRAPGRSVRGVLIVALTAASFALVTPTTSWFAALPLVAALALAIPTPAKRFGVVLPALAVFVLATGGVALPYATVGADAARLASGGIIAANEADLHYVAAYAPEARLSTNLTDASVYVVATRVDCASRAGPIEAPAAPRRTDGRVFVFVEALPREDARAPFAGVSDWLTTNVLGDAVSHAPTCRESRVLDAIVLYRLET